MKKLNSRFVVFVLALMAAAILIPRIQQAQGAEWLADANLWLLLVGVAFLGIVAYAVFQALDAMKKIVLKEKGLWTEPSEEEESQEEGDEWMQNLLHKLTDATPVEEEEKVETDHEYDGIRELDNNLPPWWLAGFYLSILFAVVYVLRYHVFESAPLQEEAFRMEMAQAEAERAEYLKNAANLVDETSVTALTDEGRILSGQAIFNEKCAVCHAKDGGGGVGPNLTDYYWLHGNSIADVFSTIKYGVPAKGMISWKDQMSPAQIQEVASYILTLEGTEPANPKEPQGDFMERVDVAEEEIAGDSVNISIGQDSLENMKTPY